MGNNPRRPAQPAAATTYLMNLPIRCQWFLLNVEFPQEISVETVEKLCVVIEIDEGRIQLHLDEVERGTMEKG